MKTLGKNIDTQNGWDIIKETYDPKQAINDGSSFMVGNGYLGYRSTLASDRKEDYVGCFVTDTWDNADGKWEELSNVPNALFRQIHYENQLLTPSLAQSFKRILDLSEGRLFFEMTFILNGKKVIIQEEKFASMHQKNLLGMRQTIVSDQDIKLTLMTGIDTEQWNLNGEHLPYKTFFETDTLSGIKTKTQQSNIEIIVGQKNLFSLPKKRKSSAGVEGYQSTIELQANQPSTMDSVMIIYTSHDVSDPYEEVISQAQKIDSYDSLKRENKTEWQKLWDRLDISLEGNIRDQVGIRFNIYHAIIATPMHKPLPIGARGLSCQAYQGAAFWDQEIYNSPMYLFSHPEVVKQLLVYRYETLDGARRKAKRHGYEGAFYAWISGKTGDEICPDFFFKDVLSDRPIRNHFNLWQIHISPDISYAIDRYYRLTQDKDFLYQYGLEMTLEIARFIASRVVYRPHLDRYELKQVQGPDEYHENVDNNAFTNYQSHIALTQAIVYIQTLDKNKVQAVFEKIHIRPQEIELWKDIIEKLYLPQPNAEGLIEQFDGYFDLESIVPAHRVTERLKDPEEYYGWPNGIAVFTQCNKQADMVQLFSLHPELFDLKIQEINYDYYEPRTLHFSSLSPSTHAIVAARFNRMDEAYRLFEKALFIDLFNTNEAVSGGTFIGGMHTANNGGTWGMVAYGFLGLQITNDGLYRLDPHLPQTWKNVSLTLDIRGHKHQITVDAETINVKNLSKTPIETQIVIRNQPVQFTDQLEYSLSS